MSTWNGVVLTVPPCLTWTNTRYGPGFRLSRYNLAVTVHERCVGDVTIIDVDGRITEDGAQALRALVQPLVRQGRIKIVFDLHNTPYIDTTALGEIVRAHAKAASEGGGLTLLHVTPKVHELLAITRLDSVLREFDDEAAALNSFALPLL
jgi:anti-sigma B factor antagonist